MSVGRLRRGGSCHRKRSSDVIDVFLKSVVLRVEKQILLKGKTALGRLLSRIHCDGLVPDKQIVLADMLLVVAWSSSIALLSNHRWKCWRMEVKLV